VQIIVCDAGAGLQGHSLDQLCAKFFSTKRHGMGLGLGICRSIIEQHGGGFVATERPEGGACFSFSLPIAAATHEMECQ
jgi:two-component system sensor histidine kinase DctS